MAHCKRQRSRDLYKEGIDGLTTLGAAKWSKRSKVASLLERFLANPAQTRRELRVKLAAERYALIVFLCDGLLKLKPAPSSSNPAAVRFFTITKRLPMELQMASVMCRGLGQRFNFVERF